LPIHVWFGIILFFFLFDPQESQCSAEFEWHTEVICMKHANSRNASRENASSSRILLEQFSPSHGKHSYLYNIKFRMLERYVNIKLIRRAETSDKIFIVKFLLYNWEKRQTQRNETIFLSSNMFIELFYTWITNLSNFFALDLFLSSCLGLFRHNDHDV